MTKRRNLSDREPRVDKGTMRPYGLRAKLTAFFEANPDEELTLEQAMTKFDAQLEAVRMAVSAMVLDGQLERVKVIRLPSKGRAQP